MAVENLVATSGNTYDPVIGHGDAGTVKGFSRTIEVTAAASDTSTYTFGYIPSNARILGISRFSHDDLASTGSPTMDIGLYPVNGNFTTGDVDAINDGIDVATAAATVALVKDIANYGLPAWDFVNGLTADPGGSMEVRVTLDDADTNTGGTITMELFYLLP